ncbi:MAG TPA: hypothetical protein VMH22_06395 [bacterium]|nr:hypothetical protein [bacterium]
MATLKVVCWGTFGVTLGATLRAVRGGTSRAILVGTGRVKLHPSQRASAKAGTVPAGVKWGQSRSA